MFQYRVDLEKELAYDAVLLFNRSIWEPCPLVMECNAVMHYLPTEVDYIILNYVYHSKTDPSNFNYFR